MLVSKSSLSGFLICSWFSEKSSAWFLINWFLIKKKRVLYWLTQHFVSWMSFVFKNSGKLHNELYRIWLNTIFSWRFFSNKKTTYVQIWQKTGRNSEYSFNPWSSSRGEWNACGGQPNIPTLFARTVVSGSLSHIVILILLILL